MTDMTSSEYQTGQKRLACFVLFASLCIADSWKFFSKINFFPLHLWAASLVFLYLLWFYRFYLNDAGRGLKIAGIKIDKSASFLFSILLIKLLFHIYLYGRGFAMFTGDSSCRIIEAYTWSMNPHFIPFNGGVWMTFFVYLHGLLFMLTDEVLWAPRLAAFLASCLLLVYFYKFTRCVFPEGYVCYFSVLMLLFYPWYVWTGATPMLETYYVAFLVCGLYYIALWLKKDRIRYLLLSSAFFILSSGFHFPGWAVINAVNLFMLYFLISFYKQKDSRRVARLLLFFFLSNLWIITYALGTLYNTGTINVFKRHIEYSLSILGWFRLSVFSKLSYYTILVIRNGSFAMWALFLAGVFYIIKNGKQILAVFPLAAAVLSLIAFSIFNLLSPPAAAKPDRYCLVFAVLLIPYMAYGLNHILSWGMPEKRRPNTALMGFFSASLLGFILFFNISRSSDFTGFKIPKSESLNFRDRVNAGGYINELFSTSALDADSKFIIERGWGCQHIALTARHSYQTVYDRENIRLVKPKMVPSVLRKALFEVKDYLLANNVKYVIVKSKDLKTHLDGLPCALRDRTFGEWAVYKVGLSQVKYIEVRKKGGVDTDKDFR